MTSFVTRNTTHLGADRIFSAPTAQALYDNLKAAFEKDASAIAAGVTLANSYVVEAMIAAASVSQGKLKTALNTISAAGAPNNSQQTILAGGRYCFLPTGQVSAGSGSDSVGFIPGGVAGPGALTLPILDSVAGATTVSPGSTATARATEYTLIMIQDSADDTWTVNVQYVNASPPYNFGQGDMEMFVFLLVAPDGRVKLCWMADDPPWAHNGPTQTAPHILDADGRPWRFERKSIRMVNMPEWKDPVLRRRMLDEMIADPYELLEITQEVKNRDMPLIPQPFSLAPGDTVVMLPAGCSMLADLTALHGCGDIGSMFKDGYIRVNNEPLDVVTPAGVMAVEADWTLTRKGG